LSDRISERRPEQNGLQFSAEDGKRRRVPNEIFMHNWHCMNFTCIFLRESAYYVLWVL